VPAQKKVQTHVTAQKNVETQVNICIHSRLKETKKLNPQQNLQQHQDGMPMLRGAWSES